MVFLTILFFMAVYILLAILFVIVVVKITKRKLFWWLTIAFVILLPIWDVILGTAVYYIGCRYIPKVAIYETAETEGIYYEIKGDYYHMLDRDGSKYPDEELIIVSHVAEPLMQGFKFVESKISQKYNDRERKNIAISPLIYRCKAVPKYDDSPQYFPTSCSVIKEPQSRFIVKVNTYKIGIAEINFKKVIDQSSGKLMAEYKRVSLWSCFPFFEWLGWRWWSKSRGSAHCPSPDNRYSSFEYEVLKPVI